MGKTNIMAQQVGPIYLQCTWDELTFYKMDGKYYARKKSRLTRERVLKHPDFEKTRYYAGHMAGASKIASSIYNKLPMHWRQFWMFRDFTGIAFNGLQAGYSKRQIHHYLWKTYIQYWVRYQRKTGIQLKTDKKEQPVRPKKTYKTRLKHRTENPQCRRYRKLIGKNHWKSKYDHTAQLLEQERKRLARQKNLEWLEEQYLKGRWKEEQLHWQERQSAKLKPPEKLVA